MEKLLPLLLDRLWLMVFIFYVINNLYKRSYHFYTQTQKSCLYKKIIFILIFITLFIPFKTSALTASGYWYSDQGTGSMMLSFLPKKGFIEGNLSGIFLGQKINNSNINAVYRQTDNSVNGTVILIIPSNQANIQLNGYIFGNLQPSGQGSGIMMINNNGQTIQVNWQAQFSVQDFQNELSQEERASTGQNINQVQNSGATAVNKISCGEIIFYVLVGLSVVGLFIYIIIENKKKNGSDF